MFEIDIRRIVICIGYKDYYSAMEYALLVKGKYKNNQKDYFEGIIKNVKSGNYKKLYEKFYLRQVSTNFLNERCYNIIV